MSSKKLILIDGSGLIYRGFYAIPPFLKSPEGVQTNAVYGFTNILLSLLAAQKPEYVAVALDKKGPTFRHKEFAEYKATRIKAPQELYDQIPLIKSVITTFNIPLYEVEGFEADDIIATIAERVSKAKDVEVLVATGDFDMFQIVSPYISIVYPTKGFKEAESFNSSKIKDKYGLSPKQITDYKGLAGDSSDNLPGVYGIGEKGAKNLLQTYGTLENIYEHIDEIPETTRKKLLAGRDKAFMSKKMATLHRDVPLDFNLESCAVKALNGNTLKELFVKLGFKSLGKRVDELCGTKQEQGALF